MEREVGGGLRMGGHVHLWLFHVNEKTITIL